jgi:bifunctional non-homologous end joining protein LigD
VSKSVAEVRAGRRTVEVSSPGKVMFPQSGITKLELARYYAEVAPVMVPLVRDRPISQHSFPAGIDHDGYYIKAIPKHFPEWIKRATVPKRGGTITHPLANDGAALVYLAGQNCITPHIWLSKVDKVDIPDRVIFDLDPHGDRGGFSDVRSAARDLGDLLRDRGLVPHAMVTGSQGIHVTVPIRRRDDFAQVFRWAKEVAIELAATAPEMLTVEFLKENREGRIYVDVRRNAYAQHAVAPYAVRPREGAPVAMPINWDELSDSKLRPDSWNVVSGVERLRSDGDAWKGFAKDARALPR